MVYSRKMRFFSGLFFLFGLVLALSSGACATAYKAYDVNLNPPAAAAEELASQGEYEKALAKYGEALSIYEKEGNEQGTLFCLERMGWFQRESGRYDEALQLFKRAYPLGERLNGDAAEIDADLGDVYLFSGDFEKARVHYGRCLDTLKDFVFKTSYGGPPSGKEISAMMRKTKAIIHARDNLGMLSYFSGEYKEALDHLRKADELIKNVLIVANHPLYGMFFKLDADIYEGSGFCYTIMGAVYGELGDPEKADAHFEEGKKAFEKGKKTFGLLVNHTLRFRYEPLLNNDATRAEAFYSNGDYDQAIAMYRKACTAYEQGKNERGVLFSLERMGWLQRETGLYGEALEMFMKAHPMGVKLNGDAAEIDADLGDVFLFSGDSEKARAHYQRTLDTLKDFVFKTTFAQPPGREELLSMIRKSKAKIHAWVNLGTLYFFEGKYDDALNNLKLAEGLINEVWAILKHPLYGRFFIFDADFYEGVGFYHTMTAAVYGQTGRFDKASKHFLAGKEAFTGGDRPYGLLVNEALRFKMEFISPNVKIDEKKFAEYERFLKQAEGLGAQEVIWRMCFEIGRALAKEKKYEKARSYLARAVDVLELTRSRLREDTIKKMFASSVQEVYAEMIELLFEMKQYEGGFNYLERAKARAFLDMLSGRSVRARKSVDPLLIEREKAVQKQIDIIERQLRSIKVKGKKELFTDYKRLLEERKNILEAIKGQSLEFAATTTVATVEARKIAGRLGKKKALLSYFLGEKRILVFILSNGEISALSVDIGKKALSDMVSQYRDAVDSHQDQTVLEVGSRIAGHIFKPAEDKIGPSKTLYIVPSGPLHYLPFSGLPLSNGRYLVQQYAVTILPNASSLFLLDKAITDDRQSILALGNPDREDPNLSLEYAEREVMTVSKNFQKTTTLTGKEARESILKNENLVGTGIIHIAAHGQYDAGFPLKSSLLLARDGENDGNLETYEIFSLNMNPRLVILSACQSGIGKIEAGDEVQGLNRAFLYAGAGGVIASLWSVSDQSTYQLMTYFYEGLKTLSPSDALKEAQVRLMTSHPSPFHWAPFYLTGGVED